MYIHTYIPVLPFGIHVHTFILPLVICIYRYPFCIYVHMYSFYLLICPKTGLVFLQDVALNMLFAGHDTTAASLTLMLRYLKQEPQVLQKVRDEQQQVNPLHTENVKENLKENAERGMPRGWGRGAVLQGWCCWVGVAGSSCQPWFKRVLSLTLKVQHG